MSEIRPDMKDNLIAARDRCPLLALIQAADGLAANILERMGRL